MTDSIGWRELPRPVQEAVEAHTGEPVWSTPGGDGWSTDLRLILQTPELGRVFLKGIGPGNGPLLDHQRARLALGADLAAHVQPLSPPVLFRVEDVEGWHITGWPALPGRPKARFSPKSADVPKVAGLLAKLAEITAPGIVTGSAREDWGKWTDEPDALEGDALVHSDPRAENFVVDGDDIWFVDWGHALRGPVWLTPALAVLELIEAGWHPRDAEQAFSGVPAWDSAPEHGVQVFADANAAMWRKASERTPDHRLRRDKAEVAQVWASFRQTRW